jgi:aspartate kinase
MVVMKFGGSSISSRDKVLRCIDLIRGELPRGPVVVVVSAHGKTTDQLISAAERAVEGTLDVESIEAYHAGLLGALDLSIELIAPLLEELRAFLQGVSLIRELTPRTLDHIMSFGERLSTRIVAAAMSRRGTMAVPVNAYEIGLLTDSRHGAATPFPGIADQIARNLDRIAGVPVVTGFLGRNPKGDITTLGRSGSDFTASIVAAAVKAEEVQIWTDVSGIMTCDPSLDSGAQSLRQLSFDEASELAYYGAEVLHPSTLVPAIHAGIPVRVLNTMHPEDEGTVILPEPVLTTRYAKSIVYKEDVNLITIASPRLMSAVQILSKAFDILTSHAIGVHMATTSEATVSMVTDRSYAGTELDAAIAALGELGVASVERGKAIVCVIGEELRGQVDALGRIFGSLTDRGIKARMVSQSASEINIAFLVNNPQIEEAVRALHALLI